MLTAVVQHKKEDASRYSWRTAQKGTRKYIQLEDSGAAWYD